MGIRITALFVSAIVATAILGGSTGAMAQLFDTDRTGNDFGTGSSIFDNLDQEIKQITERIQQQVANQISQIQDLVDQIRERGTLVFNATTPDGESTTQVYTYNRQGDGANQSSVTVIQTTNSENQNNTQTVIVPDGGQADVSEDGFEQDQNLTSSNNLTETNATLSDDFDFVQSNVTTLTGDGTEDDASE